MVTFSFMQHLFTRQYFLLFFVLSLARFSYAQIDSLAPPEDVIESDVIEDFLQNQESDQEFDFNAIYDELEIFLKKPLDLNKATAQEMYQLPMLSDIQINALINHRIEHGELISIYELQAIPTFDLPTIEALRPYVQIGEGLDAVQEPFLKMLGGGRNEVFLRWSRVLENKRGFGTDEREATYEGDPNKVYLRYKHGYSNKLSYGFTAEKDAGEAFARGSNSNGFDFYSAHFHLRDYNDRIKDIVIGDYTPSMGQGLILYAGFGRGKSGQVMNIKRNRRELLPYRSVGENNYLRGAGATIRLTDRLQITAFGSRTRFDANTTLTTDTLENEDQVASFTSFQISGLHRTVNEIEDEKSIINYTAGGILKYKYQRFQIALNTLYNKFDKPLERRIQPYNQFLFNEQSSFNTSIDYSFLYRNFNFFGETAVSSNGAVATTNSVIASVDRNLSIAILYRYFPRDYQAIYSNPFSEVLGANNENGLYLGAEYFVSRQWKVTGYVDFYKHPWLRFTADAPSRGVDYRLRLTYTKKRKIDAYIEYRDETKQINEPRNETPNDILADARRVQVRFHLGQKINKAFSIRSRLDAGFFAVGNLPKEKGISFYQDVIFKPTQSPFSMSARVAIFDTDGFNMRFYNFENDLIYTFSIPAYFGQGSRYYLNLRYKGIRNLTIEGRIARTIFSDRDEIGTGNELINGNARTEVKAQLVYRFGK